MTANEYVTAAQGFTFDRRIASVAGQAVPSERMEAVIDQADQELPPLRAFVLPGGTPKAAALHLARTVCRRALGSSSAM